MVSKSGAVAFSSIVLRWAPAWAPSGLLCFAGHGVLAAKNTIVGFEIRKFPVFFCSSGRENWTYPGTSFKHLKP